MDPEEELEEDIQILQTLMKRHLGINRKGSFNKDLTFREKEEVGMRLGRLLNVVADGAFLPLMNFTLSESQVQILASQKEMSELLLVEHLGIEGCDNFASLSKEDKYKVGGILKHLLRKVANDDLIQLINCTLHHEEVQTLLSRKVIEAYKTDNRQDKLEDVIDNEVTMGDPINKVSTCTISQGLEKRKDKYSKLDHSDCLSSDEKILDMAIENPYHQRQSDKEREPQIATKDTINTEVSTIKPWHSASTYKCMRCNKEGGYLFVDGHIRYSYGIMGKLEFGIHFNGKIEYHKCLECRAMIECDPFFINDHMSRKHKKHLQWYETKYKNLQIIPTLPNHNSYVNKPHIKQEANLNATPKENPNNTTVELNGFKTPSPTSSILTTQMMPIPNDNISYFSGELITKKWHSASSYMCIKCEVEGGYMEIYRHLWNVHGVQQMKFDVDVSVKIKHHVCLNCGERVNCDPHFIGEHLTSKHKKNMSWYESKYKERLINVKIQKKIPTGQVKHMENVQASTEKAENDDCENGDEDDPQPPQEANTHVPASKDPNTASGYVIRPWHSGNSYKCHSCEEEGDYISSMKHVREIHGKVKPHRVGYNSKINYHTCLMCDSKVESDVNFIKQHLSTKHKMTLSSYESKFKGKLAPMTRCRRRYVTV